MMPVVILLCGFICFRKRRCVRLQLRPIGFFNPIEFQRVGQPPSAQSAVPAFPIRMHVSPASRRFTGRVEPDMPIGLSYHAHQLALALYLAAAHARALGNVLRHLKLH